MQSLSAWVIAEVVVTGLTWALWLSGLLLATDDTSRALFRSHRMVLFAVAALLTTLSLGHARLVSAGGAIWWFCLTASALTPLGLRLVRRADGRRIGWPEAIYLGLSGLSVLSLLLAPGAFVTGERPNPLGFEQATLALPGALVLMVQILAVVLSAWQRFQTDQLGPLRGTRLLAGAWFTFALAAMLEVAAMTLRLDWPPLFWIGALVIASVFGRQVQQYQAQTLLALSEANHSLIQLSADLEGRVKRRTRDLEYQARYDRLTGLPNRAYGDALLSAALTRGAASGMAAALLFLDVDHFKDINDTLGHQQGDEILREIGQRFNLALDHLGRPGVLIRFGGDEFLVVLADLPPQGAEAQALEVAQALVAALAPALRIEGTDYHLDASVGISLAPRDGSDAVTLARHADAAMYRAKRGRLGPQLFTADLEAEAERRLTVLRALRRSLERTESRELQLLYQPVVQLATGQLTGVEALLRWQQDSVLVLPDAFLPVAEEHGLIVALDSWVLDEASRQGVRWRQMGLGSLHLNVNVSAKFFEHGGFVPTVRRILSSTGLPPEAITLELTESVLLQDFEDTSARIAQLRELGVRFALDDFGTGYSNLTYLQRLPFDTLKLDRSFTRLLETPASRPALVTATLSIAQDFGLSTVAEGIESAVQLDALRRLGCGYGQGFLFGAAMPPGEIEALARNQVRRKGTIQAEL